MKQYVFSVLPPALPLVREQMRAAHQYRNKLVEIELERRKACEATIHEMAPEYVAAVAERDAAQQRLNDAQQSITVASAKARKRIKPTPGQKQAVADAKEARKVAAAALKAIKEATYDRIDVQAKLAVATTAAKEAVKAARSGVYWGNYLRIDEACRSFGRGSPPRFARYAGEGTISVQLQGGLSVEDCLAGTDTRLTISLPPKLEERLAVKGVAHLSSGRATIKFRVGSDGRAPIFVELAAVVSRPLPPQGVIKWAHLDCRRIASTEDWHLRLIVDEPAIAKPQAPQQIVAVHLGYRTMPDGSLRVATAVGSDGRLRELRLAPDELDWLGKSADLRSIRDKSFEATKLELARWLKEHEQRPEWLTEECSHLAQWKSQGRLAALVIRWRLQRFSGDEGIYPALEAWRKQGKHLWLWQAHGTVKQTRRRKDLYRCFAKSLADDYQKVAIAKVAWKSLLAKPAAGEEDQISNAIRQRARLAAPAKLESLLKEKFGGDVLVVDAKHMSDTCHQCGSALRDREARLVICERCGEVDQDHNAASATLARGQVLLLSQHSLAEQSGEGVAGENGERKVSLRVARFRAAREAAKTPKQEKELESHS